METKKYIDDEGWVLEILLNDKGQEVLKIDRSPDGNIVNKVSYSYSESGECVGWSVEDGDGNLKQVDSIWINEDGVKMITTVDHVRKISDTYPWLY